MIYIGSSLLAFEWQPKLLSNCIHGELRREAVTAGLVHFQISLSQGDGSCLSIFLAFVVEPSLN